MIKLNLGAGNLIEDPNVYENHDLVKHRAEIKYACDLNDKAWFAELQRQGGCNDVEEIKAWDVIEHLDDPINFMNNCWSLLNKGGVLYMKACGYQNENFFIDITHKKAYHIRSFDYFDDSTEIGKEYGYYTKYRWKILEKNYDRKQNVIIKLTPIK